MTIKAKTTEYTFHLTGDRENYEDGFATYVVDTYGENALHEWVMNLINHTLYLYLDDAHLVSDEEYAEKAEATYRLHR